MSEAAKKLYNRVLVVDDDLLVRELVQAILRRAGYQVQLQPDGEAAIAAIAEDAPDLVLMDVMMPGLDGFETFAKLRELAGAREIPVIFITGLDDKRTIYRIFDIGAADYVGKPIREGELLARVRLHLDLRRKMADLDENLEEINRLRQRLLSGKLEKPDAFNDIVTASGEMLAIFQYLEAVSRTSRPVLVTGETGTGKELLAQAIHDLSDRPGKFVPVNVAGLDDNLFSDTLFGHARGAYTGAANARKGLIEQAGGGTLFLDEIGDIGPISQLKLLRLLQEGEYYPLGSDERKYTDARIVVATHRDLMSMIGDESFRRDLYYRLHTHHVHIPPLRERRCDVPLLVDKFLRQAAEQLGKPRPGISRALVNYLCNYDFPGNVRELEAMIFDAVSWSQGEQLTADAFQRTVGFVPGSDAKGQDFAETPMTLEAIAAQDHFPTLKEVTEALITQAVARTDGNLAQAAQLLGISRQALHKRMKRRNET